MFNFEKLEVWRKSLDFAAKIYRVTGTFPSDERFGLTNQMRRASVSISSNLAEGSSRSSKHDYGRFVELASGSLFETVSQCHIAKQQDFLSSDDFNSLYADAEELSRMLSGLRTYLTSNS